MKFDALSLKQFKCYEEATVDFEPGVTVIQGPNGSGKSTILEACFFALYGSNALENKHLDDLITIGKEEADVKLDFRNEGEEYTLERTLRHRGERAVTDRCLLTASSSESWDGVTDVEAEIRRLLRMDASAFVNCAYVRQGEVNKLIHASPSERQDIIDQLLQLGMLETYRDRASDARLGVKSRLDDIAGQRREIESQLEEHDEDTLTAQLNEIKSGLKEVNSDLETYKANKAEAESTLETAEEILKTARERRERLEELNSALETQREDIAEVERRRTALEEDRSERLDARETASKRRREELKKADVEPDETDVEEKLAQLEAQIDSLEAEHSETTENRQALQSQIERLKETAAEKRDRLKTLSEEQESIRGDIETAIEEREATTEEITALEETKKRLQEKFDAVEYTPATITDELNSVEATVTERREERTRVKEQLAQAKADLEEARELKAAGKCPKCGQPVEEAPEVTIIEELETTIKEKQSALEELETTIEDAQDQRDHLESLAKVSDRIDRVEERLADKRTLETDRKQAIETKRERLESLGSTIETLEDEIEERETAAKAKREEMAEIETTIETLEADIKSLEEKKGHLEAAQAAEERRERLVNEAEALSERIEDQEALLEEKRERLQTLRDERSDIKEAIDPDHLETAKEDRKKAEEYLEEVETAIEEASEKKQALQSRLGAVENQLETVDNLKDRLEAIERRRERVESLYEECERLESMYGNLRSELRRQNVDILESMLNEIFELLYQNDAYARIELDNQYQLTVYQKDQTPLAPSQLSGGERAIFNLSLRCAIYRLLAEGVDGAAPMPPLILDEPTVFLDEGHIGQLRELVRSMQEWGVEQTILVTHNEELAGVADQLLRVKSEPTTNRSQVTRDDPKVIA